MAALRDYTTARPVPSPLAPAAVRSAPPSTLSAMSASDTTPVEGFEESLDRFDFEAALALVDDLDGPRRRRLVRQVEKRRAEAVDRAEQLAARVQFLARADHYEALLALQTDPATAALLALVSPELRRGAMLHLDGAVRRQKRFRAAGERHMRAAVNALALLDVSKAISEMEKVDPRWLSDSQRAQLDELRAQTDLAASERKEIEDRAAAVLRERRPDPPAGKRRYRRSASKCKAGAERTGSRADPPAETGRSTRSRLGGCLGSAVAALAVPLAAVLLLLLF